MYSHGAAKEQEQECIHMEQQKNKKCIHMEQQKKKRKKKNAFHGTAKEEQECIP